MTLKRRKSAPTDKLLGLHHTHPLLVNQAARTLGEHELPTSQHQSDHTVMDRSSTVIERDVDLCGLAVVRGDDAFHVAIGGEQQPLQRCKPLRQSRKRGGRRHDVTE